MRSESGGARGARYVAGSEDALEVEDVEPAVELAADLEEAGEQGGADAAAVHVAAHVEGVLDGEAVGFAGFEGRERTPANDLAGQLGDDDGMGGEVGGGAKGDG
jgi:hypothetical protein